MSDQRARPDLDRRPLVVTIFNQKGGIGKTTTTVNLAVCLAAMGRSVALVDLDSQSNATSSLGMTTPVGTGSYLLLSAGGSLAEAMHGCHYPNLSVCGATDELVGADIELAVSASPQTMLRNSIRGQAADVDVVLIDCPPALGMLPVNALVASDVAILPVTPEPLAREGLHKAWRHINRIRVNLNPRLSVFGVLLTMTSDSAIHREFTETVRAEFGSRVLPVSVPRDPMVLTASAQEMPVAVFDPDCRASRAYIRLAVELVGWVGRPAVAAEAASAASEAPAFEPGGSEDIDDIRTVLRQWRERIGGESLSFSPPPADSHASGDESAAAEPERQPSRWLSVLWALLGFASGVSVGIGLERLLT